MSKLIVNDRDYKDWINSLCERFDQSRVRASVKVNDEMLRFYWSIGEDIVKKNAEAKWGDSVIAMMSQDLSERLPGTGGFSATNLGYMKRFYLLYSQLDKFCPQLVGDSKFEKVKQIIFYIPWGHHHYLIDKFMDNPKRAFYYAQLTLANNWSRGTLLNAIDLDLHEPEGKAITNFKATLPLPQGDLAQQITKDPYTFDFAAITALYNEKQLKDALVANINQFLLELGAGFAYIGKEYKMMVGNTEQLIDLLLYNTKIRSYIICEVKTTKFQPADIGQLGTYVAAANHILRGPQDNPCIGLLICKTKDNVLAQYALESSSLPIGISEYELSKLYPADFKGSMPTIEDIEKQMRNPVLQTATQIPASEKKDVVLNDKQRKVLKFCRKPRSAEEIMRYICISDLSNNRKRYIRVLVAQGLLAMTIPDKPNSKKQRYISILCR